jgi:hypothetical protein
MMELWHLLGVVNVDDTKLRTASKQTTRDNTLFKAVSEYNKRTYTIPMIDHLNSSLQACFNI